MINGQNIAKYDSTNSRRVKSSATLELLGALGYNSRLSNYQYSPITVGQIGW